jgi:hypothetical protein
MCEPVLCSKEPFEGINVEVCPRCASRAYLVGNAGGQVVSYTENAQDLTIGNSIH